MLRRDYPLHARGSRVADGRSVLAERVSHLDSRPIYADLHGNFDPDLAHFIRTIEAITPPGSSREQLPVAAANVADEIISNCRLVQRLIEKSPEISVGPIVRTEQYWIATGRPAHLPPSVPTLDRAHFVEPARTTDMLTSTKPFDLGLYTSTGVLGTLGMWWCALQLNEGSSLFPLPWNVWSIQASEDSNVLEITTAAEWVDFVSTYPIYRNGWLYPDWRIVAHGWDGIHMTVRTIAASQGICFSAGTQIVAPPYWDVESTLWLRWAFAAVEPLQEFEEAPSSS
jgi:hypothetical protein